MNDSHTPVFYPFFMCIAIALAIHAITAVSFTLLTDPPPTQARTVEVVLAAKQGSLTRSSAAQQSNQASQTPRVSTQSNSALKSPISNKNKAMNTGKSEQKNSPATPSLNQSNRRQLTREGLNSLFSQNPKTATKEQQKQVSTKNTKILTDYQKRLIQHMLQGKLYDQFHRILSDNDTKTLNYTLNLWLLPSGAIKNATIKTTSGISELDRLAITAAFNASPYPKPPLSDTATRFRYEIPVQYQP